MLFSKTIFAALTLALGISLSTYSLAEPWIDTSDIYLKANIQLLADTGHIITPVTTYPLMWHDIIRDIKSINPKNLNSSQQSAYYYIMHQFKLAKKNQTRVKAKVGFENKRFTTFGDYVSDKNSISIHSSSMFENFAAKFAPSYTYHPIDGDKKRLDGSYIAAFVGNWVVSLGRQERWYGPTWDTSLSLTNNARPITALAISRKSAEPFIIPFTEFDIPWTVTSFMGKMDDDRVVKNTLLWGFRLNLKPFKNLELGITRLAQWGGDGRSHNLSIFGDILLGKSNCGIDGVVCDENTPNPANQQAGYDFRYSFKLLTIPVSFYGQKFAEDGSEGTLKYFTKAQPQVGFDAHLALFGKPSTVFIEVADSLADCGERDNIGDCYYEHSSYATGMRYNGRSIGSTYENDSKTYVFGTISQLGIDTRLTAKIRYLDLNYDNQDKAPDNPIIGNTVTSIAEQVWMISSSIQHDYKNWRLTLATDISHSTFDDDISNETDFNASFMVEYNL
ncbi:MULTISPECIES: capsule assembly Wzi family protein [unclassified Colwellia]|uniref:capsule assembly Wzi family protein n=1 Tax=unclassified Colwellia TaxID=196834 RepID=UPI0015F56F9C|nr:MULTISPECIES: capsule assembly Wzi family protein [unclassified Colwellia]MBA6257088.1 capsule assembly Wzi family protein [Colwellia sp. MB3u-28]MBA6260907.1 capsule assembly Wzi family protein [Colwellia sp. MB3u-41]MBA6303780.1 capsule assembly Wzi family protein [Colwellia sp. MB02u-14]